MRRWEGLRDRFVRSYRIESQSGVDKKVTNFSFYENMLFLVPYIRRRRKIAKSAVILKQDQEYSMSNSTDGDFHEDDNDNVLNDKLRNTCATTTVTNQEFVDPTPSISKINETATETSISEGDIAFATSLASDMQLLPPLKKIKFKKDVMNILYRYVAQDE